MIVPLLHVSFTEKLPRQSSRRNAIFVFSPTPYPLMSLDVRVGYLLLLPLTKWHAGIPVPGRYVWHARLPVLWHRSENPPPSVMG